MAEAAVTKRTTLAPELTMTMQSVMPYIPTLLPPDISKEQFRAALFLELSGRPALAECTHDSVRNCVIKAATYGLLPGRDCHFLPFGNTRRGGRKEATYIPNYFGLILAMERTGKIRRAFAHPVHEGDEFQFDLFLDRPVHQPAITLGRTPGKELFYYGAVMFKDGTCAFEVLTMDDLEAVKKRAPAHESGPWVTDRVMMCRKTCIKRVAKYVRLTPELQQMLEDDVEREREDVPVVRQRQNIVDLFGEGVDPTAYGGPSGTTPLGDSGWREVVEAKRARLVEAAGDGHSEIEGFLAQIEAALKDKAYPESDGLKLADAIWQWLDRLDDRLEDKTMDRAGSIE